MHTIAVDVGLKQTRTRGRLVGTLHGAVAYMDDAAALSSEARLCMANVLLSTCGCAFQHFQAYQTERNSCRIVGTVTRCK